MFIKIKQVRINIVFIFIILLSLLLIGRIFYLQVFGFSRINKLANQLWQRNLPITADRGLILDRNGKILATNITTVTLYAVPNQIKDKDKVSKELANVLNVSDEDILKHLNKRTSLEKISPEGRQLDNIIAERIDSLNLDGIYLMKESKRYYPYGNVLSHVLGYVGIDNQGLSGLELQYDKYLTGVNGSIKYVSDGKGKKLLQNEYYEKPQNGMNLYLTIDIDVQLALENELDKAQSKYSPDGSLGLVMDPNNGEVIAMSSRPNFDSNNYKEYDLEIINRNLPIWKSYEPGSTFNIVPPESDT